MKNRGAEKSPVFQRPARRKSYIYTDIRVGTSEKGHYHYDWTGPTDDTTSATNTVCFGNDYP